MCGVIGYLGQPDEEVWLRLIVQSKVRGLHAFGEQRVNGAGIAHTRYATSGKTDQPLSLKGVTMAFNGVIDMGTKIQMEKRWSLKLETDNDGEIIMQKVRSVKNLLDEKLLAKFVDEMKGSYAGLWLTADKFIAIRNAARPLWESRPHSNVVYFASTKDILLRSGLKVNNRLLPAYKVLSWNL